MLQDEEEQTSPASQAKNSSSTSNSGNPIEDDTEGRAPEEVTFDSLKGSTQDRIKAIIRDNKKLKEENDRLQKTIPSTGVPPAPSFSPQAKEAIQKLREAGIATDSSVRQEINDSLAAMRYQSEIERLESKYSGEDGKPKFSRDEYEDYIGRHPEYRNYFPEDVYDKMYRDELEDWRSQHKEETPKRPTAPSVRPSKTSGREETLTPEYIEQRLKQADGQQWYEENKEKINRALSAMSSPS